MSTDKIWFVFITWQDLTKHEDEKDFSGSFTTTMYAETESGARNSAWELCRMMEKSYPNRRYSPNTIREKK